MPWHASLVPGSGGPRRSPRCQTTISLSAGSMARRSSGSEVTTWCECCLACRATWTSTTSECPLRRHNRPTARAVSSSKGGVDTAGSDNNRATLAWRGPPRHAWAITPAGTAMATSCALAVRSSARKRGSPRSKESRAPVSSVSPEAIGSIIEVPRTTLPRRCRPPTVAPTLDPGRPTIARGHPLAHDERLLRRCSRTPMRRDPPPPHDERRQHARSVG